MSRAAATLSAAAPLPVTGNGTGWELAVRARGHTGGLDAVPTRPPLSGCLLLRCLLLCCLLLCRLLLCRPSGGGRLLVPCGFLLGALGGRFLLRRFLLRSLPSRGLLGRPFLGGLLLRGLLSGTPRSRLLSIGLLGCGFLRALARLSWPSRLRFSPSAAFSSAA